MTLYLRDPDVRLYHGDALEQLRSLPDGSVDMVATSPPFYGLRDYGTGSWDGGDPDCDHAPRASARSSRPAGGLTGGKATVDAATINGPVCHCGARRVDEQIGLEETPDEWVARLVAVFRECRRVLADHGTLWVEIGDSYLSAQGGRQSEAGELPVQPTRTTQEPWNGQRANTDKMMSRAHGKAKDLLGQPWLLAFALRADGWYLRSEIVWHKPNPMPESVTDRPTKAHSTVFLLSKRPRYFFDADAIRSPHQHDGRRVDHVKGTDASHQHRDGPRWPENGGANARSVWKIPTEPTPFAHFATWPQALVRRMILAGTSERGKCPECGKPWVRETERVQEKPDARRQRNVGGRTDGFTYPAESGGLGNVAVTTLGWSPSCACGGQPIPAVVLDPFAGSGTTLLVARNHGRHGVGIELNADYCRIAADRLSQLSLLAETGT